MAKIRPTPIEMRPKTAKLETKPQTKPADLTLETLPETGMLDENNTTVKKT